MKQVDYIIVGLGIAGLTFCEQLIKHNKSFVVFDTGIHSSTRISSGVINPMVLKRFTPVWKAKKHIETAFTFYKELEQKLSTHFFSAMPMFRIFTSIQEQNNWIVASDKKELCNFLNSNILTTTIPHVNTPYGYGEVNFTARIDTELLLRKFMMSLQNQQQLFKETFDYLKLKKVNNGFEYKNIKASKIIFCEGASSRQNPFFKPHFLIPLKGEFITIKSPKLQLDAMLKTNIFMIPLGNHLYKIGATYNRTDFSYQNTNQAKEELLKKTETSLSCPFKLEKQVAGIRPTTKDRRPLLGELENKNMYFFTGLGTRGMMTSPSLAIQLYDFIENKKPLDKEIDIKRMKLK
ncbi:MAG: NAD(P)/FAD-dependent oxidoreductase [Flavobacteriales bacterium]